MHGTAKRVRIHNPLTALPSFAFQGIEAYSTRAMSLRHGVTLVADCGQPDLLLAAHDYYRSLGLGPDELVLVHTPPSGDLYEPILGDAGLRAKIADHIGQGYRLEFFNTRDDIEAGFVRELGLPWSRVASHPSELADTWNDKTELRRAAKAHGLDHLFPPYYVVDDPDELRRRVRQMLNEHQELVIKRPSWSSGQGMIFGSDNGLAERYCREQQGVPTGTIVERSLGGEHIPMSIVTEFEDGKIVDQWFTEQICRRDDGTIVYDGLVLGDMPNLTHQDLTWMREATAPLYRLVRTAHPQLTGIINFDCLRRGEEIFVLECNARVTFSTYIQDIRRGLLAARPEATCLVRQAVPQGIRDFAALRLALGPTLLTDPTQSGVIPIVLGCLATAGYCYLVAVADSYRQASAVMAEARARLEGPLT